MIWDWIFLLLFTWSETAGLRDSGWVASIGAFMKCQLLMSSRNHLLFSLFRPIQPILAWVDWPVCASLSGFIGEKKKVLDRQAGLRECECRNFQKMELNDSWSGTGLTPGLEETFFSSFLGGNKSSRQESEANRFVSLRKDDFQGVFHRKWKTELSKSAAHLKTRGGKWNIIRDLEKRPEKSMN